MMPCFDWSISRMRKKTRVSGFDAVGRHLEKTPVGLRFDAQNVSFCITDIFYYDINVYDDNLARELVFESSQLESNL